MVRRRKYSTSKLGGGLTPPKLSGGLKLKSLTSNKAKFYGTGVGVRTKRYKLKKH